MRVASVPGRVDLELSLLHANAPGDVEIDLTVQFTENNNFIPFNIPDEKDLKIINITDKCLDRFIKAITVLIALDVAMTEYPGVSGFRVNDFQALKMELEPHGP